MTLPNLARYFPQVFTPNYAEILAWQGCAQDLGDNSEDGAGPHDKGSFIIPEGHSRFALDLSTGQLFSATSLTKQFIFATKYIFTPEARLASSVTFLVGANGVDGDGLHRTGAIVSFAARRADCLSCTEKNVKCMCSNDSWCAEYFPRGPLNLDGWGDFVSLLKGCDGTPTAGFFRTRSSQVKLAAEFRYMATLHHEVPRSVLSVLQSQFLRARDEPRMNPSREISTSHTLSPEQRFRWYSRLLADAQHRYSHSQKNASAVEPGATSNMKKEENGFDNFFLCETCSRTFSLRSNLNRHTRGVRLQKYIGKQGTGSLTVGLDVSRYTGKKDRKHVLYAVLRFFLLAAFVAISDSCTRVTTIEGKNSQQPILRQYPTKIKHEAAVVVMAADPDSQNERHGTWRESSRGTTKRLSFSQTLPVTDCVLR